MNESYITFLASLDDCEKEDDFKDDFEYDFELGVHHWNELDPVIEDINNDPYETSDGHD